MQTQLSIPTKTDCIREDRDSSDVDSIRLGTITNSDPNDLTDHERFAWYQFFNRTTSELRYSCMVFSSEEIAQENAEKRIREETGSNDLGRNRGVWIDAYELLDRPYLSLSISERAVLRESIVGDGDCRRYYPRLFTGRWIPLLEER